MICFKKLKKKYPDFNITFTGFLTIFFLVPPNERTDLLHSDIII